MTNISKPCVLVAEDEPLVAMLLEDLLDASGYRVLIAERLDAGLLIAKSEAVNVAILDVTLGRADSFPIADALHSRNIPFLFASGHGRESIPERFDGADVLQKPYDMKGIKSALEKLVPKA
ncbi:response regulator [Dyella sp. S184]|jgi:DNA-binding response OmpR family regulator|uniref:response regulator n=1 Tax=Dyella sp. S184 TaxID=1641862 RepID=UPI00131D1223|nr:response regulator [Dyella sp. S184]